MQFINLGCKVFIFAVCGTFLQRNKVHVAYFTRQQWMQFIYCRCKPRILLKNKLSNCFCHAYQHVENICLGLEEQQMCFESPQNIFTRQQWIQFINSLRKQLILLFMVPPYKEIVKKSKLVFCAALKE